MPRPIHFELTADDPDRATKFYGDVFGWRFNKWEGPQEYWLAQTGETGAPGIDGGLMRRSPGMSGTTNTIDVASVDDFVEKITQSGGTIVVPKMAVPGIGYMAYCHDTEGNMFGIMEMDEGAK